MAHQFVHRRVPRIVPLRLVMPAEPISRPKPPLAQVIAFPRRTPPPALRFADPRRNLAPEVLEAFREARHGRT